MGEFIHVWIQADLRTFNSTVITLRGTPQSSQQVLPQWAQNFLWNLQNRNLKYTSP